MLKMFFNGVMIQIPLIQFGQDFQSGQIQLHLSDLLVVQGNFCIQFLSLLSRHEGLG